MLSKLFERSPLRSVLLKCAIVFDPEVLKWASKREITGKMEELNEMFHRIWDSIPTAI